MNTQNLASLAPVVPSTMKTMEIDVALAVGHATDEPGALAADGRTTETAWCSALADDVQVALDCLGVRSRIYYRTAHGSLYRRMRALCDDINGSGALVACELHFNSAPFGWASSPRFRGASGLHWPGSKVGALLAERLATASAESLGILDRGPDSRGDLLFLRMTRAPAVLVETCYGSHPLDWAAATEPGARPRLGSALAAGILDVIKPRESTC